MQSKYHFEDIESVNNYQRWIQVNETRPLVYKPFSYNPKFSVVIPVYNTVTYQLEECIQSVLAQPQCIVRRNKQVIRRDKQIIGREKYVSRRSFAFQ